MPQDTRYRKPPDPADRVVKELRVISLALAIIALKMPMPSGDDTENIADAIKAATAKLRSNNATLQGAVDTAPPTP